MTWSTFASVLAAVAVVVTVLALLLLSFSAKSEAAAELEAQLDIADDLDALKDDGFDAQLAQAIKDWESKEQ